MALESYPFKFNSSKKGLQRVLGDLEAEIMQILWTRKKATVKEVHQALTFKKHLAYTTVMTVMGRLAKKGLLAQRKVGKAYVYSPKVNKNSFIQSMIKAIFGGLSEEFSGPVLNQFVNSLGEEDKAIIMELAKLIEEKKRQQGKN